MPRFTVTLSITLQLSCMKPPTVICEVFLTSGSMKLTMSGPVRMPKRSSSSNCMPSSDSTNTRFDFRVA